jgi:uridine phosphorylase
MTTSIQASELLINPDGSIFHLHLLPEELADDIILVGDPGRVETIASYFDQIECKKKNREFYTITGWYRSHRFSVISTGIGPDNIDIVINELDALANIDLHTQTIKTEKKKLNIVRIGTSGAVQADIPIHSFVISEKNIGCDGVLRFYANHQNICQESFEDAFIQHCQWSPHTARPYVVQGDTTLIERLHSSATIKGITLTAVGFYGPQGRVLRLPLAMPGINDRITTFRYNEQKITNYEMESAAITGLCNLLGHRSTTICLIIANRITGQGSTNYQEKMQQLIQTILL